MAKNKSSFEGQELAPMEPWRPEYAPQAVSSGRSPASTIVAFVLAAGFGLSIGGVFASQAGILPPLGGTESAAVVDQSPDASVDPAVDPTVDPGLVVDVTPAPSDVPVVDPAPATDPVVIPPPPGGGSGDQDGDEDDDGEGDGDDDGEDGEDD
ncbi:MAG: hypothetical protein WCK50_01250 [bacterium]|jgi:hypothetical protein